VSQNINNTEDLVITAVCNDANAHAVGGSWQFGNINAIRVHQSYQSASNSWSIKVSSGYAQTTTVRLSAICIG